MITHMRFGLIPAEHSIFHPCRFSNLLMESSVPEMHGTITNPHPNPKVCKDKKLQNIYNTNNSWDGVGWTW